MEFAWPPCRDLWLLRIGRRTFRRAGLPTAEPVAAESLCGLQIQQFRKKYGIVDKVSDRGYVTNSFHCHVTENIGPIEKQDLEGRFWDLLNGGKIQYVKYPISYNTKAVESLIKRAMDKGFYEGVNIEKNYCDDCGAEFEDGQDECPVCHSKNITQINRVCGFNSLG